MKNLSFTKDDILSAIINCVKNKDTKAIIVEELMFSKIERLRDEISLLHEQINMLVGEDIDLRTIWSTLDINTQQQAQKLLLRSNKILTQLEEYEAMYDTFQQTSFSGAKLNGFSSKIMHIFQWEPSRR